MNDEAARQERINGYRDELLRNLHRAYQARRESPDLSLQFLRQAAEGLCICTLLAKNRIGLEQRHHLDKLIADTQKFLADDELALRALQEWGNRASHAQGRPDRATTEVAIGTFMYTASPLRWLHREIFREPVPDEIEAYYRAINAASRSTPAVVAPPVASESVNRPAGATQDGPDAAPAVRPVAAVTSRSAEGTAAPRGRRLLLAAVTAALLAGAAAAAIAIWTPATSPSVPVTPEFSPAQSPTRSPAPAALPGPRTREDVLMELRGALRDGCDRLLEPTERWELRFAQLSGNVDQGRLEQQRVCVRTQDGTNASRCWGAAVEFSREPIVVSTTTIQQGLSVDLLDGERVVGRHSGRLDVLLCRKFLCRGITVSLQDPAGQRSGTSVVFTIRPLGTPSQSVIWLSEQCRAP